MDPCSLHKHCSSIGGRKVSKHIKMFQCLVSITQLCNWYIWIHTYFIDNIFVSQTETGMWLIPFALSLYNHYWRFVGIWCVISILTLALIFRPLFYKSLNSHGSSIPRLVYRWFFYLYSVSSVIAVTGYTIVMLTLIGVNILLGIKPMYTLDIGVLMLFYGIYYGVLTRDFTDFLVDLLAANIGYYSPSSSLPSKQLNSKICAICGRPHAGPMSANSSTAGLLATAAYYEDENGTNSNGGNTLDPALSEKTYTLTCGHIYHQYCIFGWCLVGKKQVCPFCREKVDLNKLFSSLPFQKPHYLYGNLLDFIRYLIAWQPIILFAVQCVNHLFGLEWSPSLYI